MAHLRVLYAMTLIEGLPEELRLDSKDDLGQYTQNIKGQLISKCPFWCLQISQKSMKLFKGSLC